MELEKVAAEAFLDEIKKIFGELSPGEKIAGAELFEGLTVEKVAAMMKEAGFFDRMKSFVGGGTQNGIPMHSLGQQLAQSNPFTGMGASLASSARQAGGAIAGAAQRAGGAVSNFIRGGNQNGIPMQSLGQQMAASNPLHGMMGSLKQNVPGMMGRLGGGGGGAQAMAPHPAMG